MLQKHTHAPTGGHIRPHTQTHTHTHKLTQAVLQSKHLRGQVCFMLHAPHVRDGRPLRQTRSGRWHTVRLIETTQHSHFGVFIFNVCGREGEEDGEEAGERTKLKILKN
ncbi:hypothetical protein ElyMa_004465100 [Elysia marginata]|uniref:Uncharacterized protein n=1 Tax=Elysia marginata TaxID=1093978 RepID=A0AAV4HFM0_9GAST|nr:hypothetical protein ElyMa_004465100 [Elysia marginata]